MTGIRRLQAAEIEAGMRVRVRFLSGEQWRRVRSVDNTGFAVRIAYEDGPADVARVGVRYEQQIDDHAGPDDVGSNREARGPAS